MTIAKTFVFSFILIVSILSCNFSEEDRQINQPVEKNQLDSTTTISIPEVKKTFQGKKIWIKQFQCDGSFYTSKIFIDSYNNLFWFVSFRGILKIDSVNTFTNYSDKLLILQFDSNGNLNKNQYVGNNKQNLLTVLRYYDSFYPVFTEQPPLHGLVQSLARSMGNNIKYNKEKITIYEISADVNASIYVNFHLENQKSISTIQFDENQNIILAGSKDIELEWGMGQCTPYTAITNSIPYIEKRKIDTLLWEFTCSNSCIGSVNNLHIDIENNIWINFEINNCDAMPCFNTAKYSGTREITFIAKISENGKLIFNKEMPEGISRWLKIQNFKKDKIIIHSNSSCFTYWGVKHPPVSVYDLEFNKQWEKCFSDSTDSRFDFLILPQDNQILALGHKRTGAIQQGEKRKDYLGKQKVILLRYDTLGKLKWQKTINQPLRILDLEKGEKEKYYVMLESDSYLYKRIDYNITIEDEQFNTGKKDNYFLIKYK